MKKVSSRTLYNVTTRGLKAIKTRLIKTLGIKVSFQRAFEDGQRRIVSGRLYQARGPATVTHTGVMRHHCLFIPIQPILCDRE